MKRIHFSRKADRQSHRPNWKPNTNEHANLRLGTTPGPTSTKQIISPNVETKEQGMPEKEAHHLRFARHRPYGPGPIPQSSPA